MTNKVNITTYDKVVEAYRRNFNNYPFWLLYEGSADKGARVDNNFSLSLSVNTTNPVSDEELDSDESFEKSINRLNDVVGEFESGIFTIYFKSNNTNASDKISLKRTFQVGEGNDSSSGNSFLAGFNPGKNKGGDLITQFFMSAAIKGLETGKTAEMMRLELELEKLKLKQEHDKDIERLESSVSNRIMGFVDENSDRVLDLIEKVAPAFSLAVKGKMPSPPPINNNTSTNSDFTQKATPLTTALHDLPIDYNLNFLSSDSFLTYATAFRNTTKMNPNVVWAKMVYFANLDPASFQMAANMIDEKIREANANQNTNNKPEND